MNKEEKISRLFDKKKNKIVDNGVLNGAFLFDIKDTHGLPIDMTLDICISKGIKVINWPQFIERARECGWWDFQTYAELQAMLLDIPSKQAILNGFKNYVLANPLNRPTEMGIISW